MPETELDREIAEALQNLNRNGETPSTDYEVYIDGFKASARRKAQAVLALLKDGTFPAKRPVFVSIGGGDGEELIYLLEHSNARQGILLEYSPHLASLARARTPADGKIVRVFEGSAQSRIGEAMVTAADLVRHAEGDGLIVTCHAVIHELYDRSAEPFDELGFFGSIFEHDDVPIGLTYREPGDVVDWPEELLISADCDPASMRNLAQAIALRHQSFRNLRPEPQIIAGQSLRLHRVLGLELLAKLFYLDDLPHEIQERSTAVDHARLNNAIHVAVGDNARIDSRIVAQTHAGPTGSFIEKWKSFKVRIEGINADKSKGQLSIPEFQKRAIVWRMTPNQRKSAEPLTPNRSPANYDPKLPAFNVPYSPKREAVIGRTDGMQQLRDQLTKGRRTAIGQTAAFNGLGGLGKTQMAVEYAWEYRESYPNGVIWIEADQDIDAQLIALAVNARWVAEASEHRFKLEVARKRLRSFSNCLIIFDNVEQRTAIAPYLPEPNASPHLLVTSREPQPGFEAVRLAPLDPDQSLRLLIQEAGRIPESPQAMAAAQEIARRLDGLPLALEISGAYLHEMSAVSFEEFWRLLDRDPQIHIGRDYLSSFTRHEADLDTALRISDRALQHQPRLEAIMDLLTWSGAAAMGTALMGAVLQADPLELVDPLAYGARLHLLKEERSVVGSVADRRYRIHRLVREVRRAKNPIDSRAEWVAGVAERIGGWFEEHRQSFVDLNQYEAEIDHLRAWQEHANRSATGHSARLLWLEAYPAWHRGEYRESRRLLECATACLSLPHEATELDAHLLNDLGTTSIDLGNYSEALEHQRKALALRRELLDEKHPDTAVSYDNVGSAYGKLGEYQSSLEYHLKALALRREHSGEKHPRMSASYNNVGVSYARLGQNDLALKYQLKALALRRELLGEKHPEMAASYNNIGGTYGELGRNDLALEHQLKALALRRELLGEKHPDMALAYNNVGRAYSKLKEHRRALEYCEKACQTAIATLGLRHPNTIQILNALALERANNGRSREGLELIQQALRSLPESHREIPQLRKTKQWFLHQYPLLRSLASAHPPKKPRNRKRR
jgi:tetratricopeptide (TPR) repeat protein